MKENLAELRKQISKLDIELLNLLKKRLEISISIGKCKKKLDLEIQNNAIEAKIIMRNRLWASSNQITPKFIEKLTRLILSESKDIQEKS